jgi:hypothetical protein
MWQGWGRSVTVRVEDRLRFSDKGGSAVSIKFWTWKGNTPEKYSLGK